MQSVAKQLRTISLTVLKFYDIMTERSDDYGRKQICGFVNRICGENFEFDRCHQRSLFGYAGSLASTREQIRRQRTGDCGSTNLIIFGGRL